MPIVKIDYEKSRISTEEVKKVAEAIQKFTAQVTGYDNADISVFAAENQITINAAPIEIYIYANFPTATDTDLETMLKKLRELVIPFKQENNIDIPFNLSVAKMQWKFELEV
jgi:hypothetical protein